MIKPLPMSMKTWASFIATFFLVLLALLGRYYYQNHFNKEYDAIAQASFENINSYDIERRSTISNMNSTRTPSLHSTQMPSGYQMQISSYIYTQMPSASSIQTSSKNSMQMQVMQSIPTGYFFSNYYSSPRCSGEITFVESYTSGVCIRTKMGSMRQDCTFKGDNTQMTSEETGGY